MLLRRLPAPGEAVLVKRRLDAAPTQGGTAALIAGRLAAEGTKTELLSFAGDDPDGLAYLEAYSLMTCRNRCRRSGTWC